MGCGCLEGARTWHGGRRGDGGELALWWHSTEGVVGVRGSVKRWLAWVVAGCARGGIKSGIGSGGGLATRRRRGLWAVEVVGRVELGLRELCSATGKNSARWWWSTRQGWIDFGCV